MGFCPLMVRTLRLMVRTLRLMVGTLPSMVRTLPLMVRTLPLMVRTLHLRAWTPPIAVRTHYNHDNNKSKSAWTQDSKAHSRSRRINLKIRTASLTWCRILRALDKHTQTY